MAFYAIFKYMYATNKIILVKVSEFEMRLENKYTIMVFRISVDDSINNVDKA